MTSKRWAATLGALTKAIVLSCSICLAAAQSDIETQARSRVSDPAIADALKDLEKAPAAEKAAELRKLEGLVKRFDVTAAPLAGDDIAAKAKSLKKNPLYADPAEGQQANWLANSMEKLRRAIEKRMPRNNRRANPMGAPDVGWIGPLLTYFAWGVLAALVGFFIYLIAKHVRWKATLQRRAKAVLEEDEPERTLDEWLALADEHEKAGRYREAVRCLYLACLLKFDEAGVARFDRGQTNWEHLARIQVSPKLPADLNFRSPTQHFDRVWYGHIVRGYEDVAEFRAVYIAVRDASYVRKAA